MAQRLLAITLGTTSAKLSEISKAGKKVNVYSCYDIQISEGLCDDGVVLNPEALAQELRHYISNFGIKTKSVVFSIASKRVASKEVVIPFVKEKQIKGIVEINAPDYFPVANIDDYVINYSIIEIVKTEENTQYRLNVTATPNELLLGYEELAKALGVDIDVIDFAGNAILQILKYQTEPGAVCAILQLGYENTVINLMNGSVQIMQRTVSNGLSNLISAVCDNVGLNEIDAVAFLEDNDITRIASAYPDVKYIFDQIVTSIGRIFEFYNSRSADHPIAYVKFIGDATYVNGIGPALEMGLGYQTTEIFTLKNVDVRSRVLTPEHATNFMSNIGAVIAPMSLQYRDAEAKDKEKSASSKPPIWLIAFSIIAAAAMVGGSYVTYSMSEDELSSLESKVSSLRPMAQLETQMNNAVAVSNSIAGFYDSTIGPNDGISTLINDLEKIMPDTMSIDAMTIDNGVVSISGGAVGKKKIAKFIQDLKQLEYVSDFSIDYVNESSDGVSKYDEFAIRFRIVYIDKDKQAEETGSEGQTGQDTSAQDTATPDNAESTQGGM